MKPIPIATLAVIAFCFVGPPRISAAPADGGAIGNAATDASVLEPVRSKSGGGSSSGGGSGSSGSMSSGGSKTGSSHKTQKKGSCTGSPPFPGCICRKGNYVC
jgi:hypothetical protein